MNLLRRIADPVKPPLLIFSETEMYLDLSGEVLSLMERVSNIWKCLACQYENTRKTNMFEHVEAKGRFHSIHVGLLNLISKGGERVYNLTCTIC